MIVLSDHGHISGRATQLAISSFNGLAEAGLDVVFVSGVGPVDSVIKRDIVDVVNFGLHDLLENPSRIQAFVRGVWDSRCADRLRDVLAECDPADTIVYRHSWMKSLSSTVVQAASLLNSPVLRSVREELRSEVDGRPSRPSHAGGQGQFGVAM
jgi:hypothetical protein